MLNNYSLEKRVPAIDRLEEQMTAFIRAFGLHRNDVTPCGQPFSVSEAHALSELERNGRLSQTELAARLRLDKSTVSRLARRMERMGWLLRDRVESDNRLVALHLTTHGRAAARRLAAARQEKFARILAHTSPPDQAAIVGALRALVRAIDESGSS